MNRWEQAFAADPKQAVSDLFSGRLGLGSAMRLDVPQILYQEFPNTDDYADARKELAVALHSWLQDMRSQYPTQVRRLGFSVYSLRLCDALICAQLIDLPQLRYQLREQLSSWLNFFTPLRLASERDPALECWRTLSFAQTDDSLWPDWLKLAEDGRREYLHVALLGLQRLPNGGDARLNQQLQVHAVLQHAARLPNLSEAERFYEQQGAVLRSIYPLGPAKWQELWQQGVKQFRVSTPFAKELRQKLRDADKAKTKAPQGGKRGKAAPRFEPASKEEREALLKDINNANHDADGKLTGRLLKLLSQDYAYAQTTGDTYHFVRSLNNAGNRLLKLHSLSQTSLQQLQHQLERSLELQSMNEYTWMLWAQWLAYQQHHDAREWVLRETVRLFPNHGSSRVELARLLKKRGDTAQAERWLREGVDMSLNNESSCVELARLLMARHDAQSDNEAERLLLDVTGMNPNHAQSHVVLAQFWYRKGKREQAIELLSEFIKRNPHARRANKVLTVIRSDDKQALALLADEELDEDIGRNSDSVLRRMEDGKAATLTETPSASEPLDSSLQTLLAELEQRARWQIAFGEQRTDELQRAAEHGDTLALFYLQSLTPVDVNLLPPNVFALHANHLWRQSGGAEPNQNHHADWQALKQQFPQQRDCLEFLSLQQHWDEKLSSKLIQRLKDSGPNDPRAAFMANELQNRQNSTNYQTNSNNIVRSILTSYAAEAPIF